MKTMRLIVLLGLVLSLASCAGLPPVFPGTGPKIADEVAPEAVVEVAPAAEATTEATTEAAEEPAAPAEEPAAPAEEPAAPAEEPAAPAEEPAAPAEEPAAPEQVMLDNPLAGVVWEWAAQLKMSPKSQVVVPNPAAYTLTFGAEGALFIQADCNNARATYELVDQALAIEIGPVTRAQCMPGSMSGSFLTVLSQVESYQIDDDDLILRLADTGDTLIFRNGGPAPEAEAPAAEAPAGSTAPAEEAAPALAGVTWQWEAVQEGDQDSLTEIANPEAYTVTFNEDGTVSMKADCNVAAGTYTAEGESIAIVVGPVTLAACGPESLGADFLINLTMAGTYLFDDEGKLVINLVADAGDLILVAAE